MKNLVLIPFFLLLLFNFACDNNPAEPVYQKEVVVYGFLQANQPLNQQHAIMISYTRPINQVFKESEAVITNAAVTLIKVGSDNIEYTLSPSREKPGYYFNDQVVIEPKQTYNLEVRIDGNIITATTTVPPILTVTTSLRTDTVNVIYPKKFSAANPVFLECEKPDQVILVDEFCKETWETAEYINIFHDHKKPDDQNEYEGGQRGEPRRIYNLIRMNDLNSDNYPGRYVIDWYSAGFVFYGSYTMDILAIDENYHNYLWQENPVYKGGITGGIGVFGSFSGKGYEFYLVKP